MKKNTIPRHIHIGNLGEKIAKKFLKKNGFRIIGENIKLSYYEIDIIALKNSIIHFIEVKTRCSQNNFGTPSEAVNKTKQNKLKSGAARYLSNLGLKEKYQFDVLALNLNEDGTKENLDFYEKAF